MTATHTEIRRPSLFHSKTENDYTTSKPPFELKTPKSQKELYENIIVPIRENLNLMMHCLEVSPPFPPFYQAR